MPSHRVKNIKNWTVNADLSAGTSEFHCQPNCPFQPDLAIIRQITFSGPTVQVAGSFLIWCSLINDFIGSFQISQYGLCITPNTEILLQGPLSSDLRFQIFTIEAGSTTAPYTGLVGDLSIGIDFIRY